MWFTLATISVGFSFGVVFGYFFSICRSNDYEQGVEHGKQQADTKAFYSGWRAAARENSMLEELLSENED